MKRSGFKNRGKGFKRPTLASLKRPENRSGFSLKRSAGLKNRGNKPLRAKPDSKLAAWSREVRERDGNECQWPTNRCLNRGTLHAHHIATRSRRPDLIYEVSNGVTLCFLHHRWCHDNPIEATTLGLLSDATYEKSRKDAARAA